jgi:hypothetical protein
LLGVRISHCGRSRSQQYRIMVVAVLMHTGDAGLLCPRNGWVNWWFRWFGSLCGLR